MAANVTRVNPLSCDEVGPRCPVEASIYGYYPTLGGTAFFVALFALCFFVNIYLGIRSRTWTYMIAMTLACIAAGLGYGGRIMLANNPFDMIGFEIQICCLTMSPAFNSAAVYLILKHVVRSFGREWSRIRPKYYTWGFITADVLALILQAVGGAMAATAGNNNNKRDTGDKVMITGISWQVATLLVFGVMITDYIIRRRRSGTPLSTRAKATMQDFKFQVFAVSLVIIYFAILTRCIYRIAEMAGGWGNPIMQNQALFIGADSSLVGLATLLQTFVHPGICFPVLAETKMTTSSEEKTASDSSLDEPAV